jgi:hypothetical protein
MCRRGGYARAHVDPFYVGIALEPGFLALRKSARIPLDKRNRFLKRAYAVKVCK